MKGKGIWESIDSASKLISQIIGRGYLHDGCAVNKCFPHEEHADN